MNSNDIDAKITKALHAAGDPIAVDEKLEQQVKWEITRRQRKQKERLSMKRKYGKWITIVCVMLLTVSTAAYAVSNMGSIIGHTDHRQDFLQPPSVSQMQDAVGYAPQYAESFSNGWVFDTASIVEQSGTDQNGQAMPEWKTISFGYKNDAVKKGWVMLDTSNVWENGEDTGKAVQIARGEAEMAGIYMEQVYKIVPPDYQLTEEDKAAEANGSLTISYGSDQVEQKTMRFLQWRLDGINYLLLTDCAEVDEAALTMMAGEIVTAQ